MSLVAGSFCTSAEHVCLEHVKRMARGWVEGECKRYRPPALCHSRKKVPMRFCMDRWEWPNRAGELPRTLVSWNEAKAACEGIGKRLCTADEWTFACEGEEIRPHVHGWERDGSICNYDKPYRERTFNYKPHDACMLEPACKAEYDRLDQRLPAGSLARCVSPEGIFDLNGNANEWVMRPEQPFAKRSGLKGGWWGPVRDRCRPMTTFHGESDYGYEVGFRCCKDAGKDAST